MPTLITHALVGASLSSIGPQPGSKTKLVALLAILSVLPDIDVIGFRYGISYSSVFGHRGITHSLPFAALVGLLCSLLAFQEYKRFSRQFWVVALLLTAATASHGILDSFTNAGLGVGFFIPFDETRYFAPWRPLAASPLSISRFLSGPGSSILANEMKWVGIPVLSASVLVLWVRRKLGPQR